MMTEDYAGVAGRVREEQLMHILYTHLTMTKQILRVINISILI